jgi:hypothetical protein
VKDALLSEPLIAIDAPFVAAPVSTGVFCSAFGPPSKSPGSLGVTPSPMPTPAPALRSMPMPRLP